MEEMASIVTDNLDIWTDAIERKATAGRGRSKKFGLYGIEKLRALILDLAIRGKLVSQIASEEPASDLLKRIGRERTQLLKLTKIRTPKPIVPVSRPPFCIPLNWQWSQIAEIGVLSPRNDAPDDAEASFVPMPMIAAEYGILNDHVARPWAEIKTGYTHFSEGDVGLAKITPCFENGKSTVFKNLTGGFGSGTTELHIVRPLIVEPNYILIFLKSPYFIQAGIPKMTGTAGQKRVPTEYFANAPLPLPPLGEQRRIVNKVDELMSLCDALEARTYEAIDAHELLVEHLLDTLTSSRDAEELAENWARIETHFDILFTTEASIEQLKQAILQLAVIGKLVQQDPNDEPASKLLKRICPEASPKLKAATQPIHRFGIPVGWCWCSFGKLGTILGGGTPSKSNPEYWDGNIPWVSPKDMKQDYIDDAEDMISQSAIENSSVKLIAPNNLLIVVRGMILAHSFPVALTRTSVTINQDMKAIEIKEMNLEYVLILMKGMKGQFLEIVDRSTHGTCKLESQKLWSIDLPIPPLNEQKRIVKKVSELIVLIDKLRLNIIHANSKKIELARAIVSKTVV